MEEVEVNPNPLYGRDDITLSTSLPVLDGAYHSYDNSLYCLETSSSQRISDHSHDISRPVHNLSENQYESIPDEYENENHSCSRTDPCSPIYNVPRPLSNPPLPQRPLSPATSTPTSDYEVMADLAPMDDVIPGDEVYESISDLTPVCKENCPLTRPPRKKDGYSMIHAPKTESYNELIHGRSSIALIDTDNMEGLYYS